MNETQRQYAIVAATVLLTLAFGFFAYMASRHHLPASWHHLDIAAGAGALAFLLALRVAGALVAKRAQRRKRELRYVE